MLIDGNTDSVKSFEIERMLNKKIVSRGCGNSIKYLVYWKGYGPEWDRWYNVKNLDNTVQLVLDYENRLQGT